jgi:hypothetical protein
MKQGDQSDASTLRTEKSILVKQLEETENKLTAATTPVLTPEEVSEMVERLLASLDSQLSGVRLRDAELRLKVGVQEIGGQKGFVVAGPGSPTEVRDSLQEVSIRFDSAGKRQK